MCALDDGDGDVRLAEAAAARREADALEASDIATTAPMLKLIVAARGGTRSPSEMAQKTRGDMRR